MLRAARRGAAKGISVSALRTKVCPSGSRTWQEALKHRIFLPSRKHTHTRTKPCHGREPWRFPRSPKGLARGLRGSWGGKKSGGEERKKPPGTSLFSSIFCPMSGAQVWRLNCFYTVSFPFPSFYRCLPPPSLFLFLPRLPLGLRRKQGNSDVWALISRECYNRKGDSSGRWLFSWKEGLEK